MVYRRCLGSSLSQNDLIKHKQKCEQRELTSIKVSNESHIFWIKYFHNDALYFSTYVDVKADNESIISNMGSKTSEFSKQDVLCNGY